MHELKQKMINSALMTRNSHFRLATREGSLVFEICVSGGYDT